MTLGSSEKVEKDGWISVSLELKKLDANTPTPNANIILSKT